MILIFHIIPHLYQYLVNCTAIYGVCVIVLIIILNGSFLRKLSAVYKHSTRSSHHEDNDLYVHVITKTVLLGVISTSLSLLSLTMVPLNNMIVSVHWGFMYHLSYIFDVYTNFICILLSSIKLWTSSHTINKYSYITL